MWKVPLFDLSLDKKELDAINDVIRSGWLTMGELTRSFEYAFAEFTGARYAFAVASGTAALHLAMLALDIGNGDEVICPSLTFVAGANAILYSGAQPVFTDIMSDGDFNISPKAIEGQLTERTKGIEVVHYAGYPCDMEHITKIAQKYDVSVIEDCAHAPGATYNGQACGTIGDIGCFSFFSNKNMTTAEGGMITTNNENLARRIKLLRSHGMTTMTLDRHRGHTYSYDVVEAGYNYRIDEIRSALGLIQLQKLPQNNDKRRQLTIYYRNALQDVPNISLPFSEHCQRSSYHIFPILLNEEINRKQFMERMKVYGIQTSIHYPPIHLFSYYREKFGCQPGILPFTETVADREVTLPLYPHLSFEDIDYIVESIQTIVEG